MFYSRESEPVSRSIRRRGAAGLIVTAAVLVVAGCSGTSDPSSTSGATTGDAGAEVSAAQTAIEPYLETPTEIPQTVPLDAAPKAGGLFVYTQCQEFSTCKIIGDASVAAAEAAGWEAKVITYSSNNPATLVSALQQALAFNPDAVALTGLPESTWASVLPEYEAAGVPIITAQVGPQDITDTVIANIYPPEDAALDGEILANWMIADSNGTGHAVIENVPGFPVLAASTPAFQDTVTANCAGCGATSVDATIQQVSTAADSNGVLTSALQREPDATYAVSTDLLLNAGLPAALQTAGLSQVKVIGTLATAESMQQMYDGKESAMTATPYEYQGWSIVDAALRHAQGMAIEPGNGGVPHQLLLPDSGIEPSDVSGQPEDFQDQFKALWKVG